MSFNEYSKWCHVLIVYIEISYVQTTHKRSTNSN